ncbi:MAG: hypothetical protein ACQEUZ_01540 [Pseudomonadota bacterium]
MKHYSRLDGSLKETAICFVDETGTVVNEMRAPKVPATLAQALEAAAVLLERSASRPARRRRLMPPMPPMPRNRLGRSALLTQSWGCPALTAKRSE